MAGYCAPAGVFEGEPGLCYPLRIMPSRMDDSRRIVLLEPPTERVEMVLDTDAYNEIDDQFAVVYALTSPEKIDLRAITAAPFHNSRSDGPRDGMEKSYEEILRLLGRMGVEPDGLVCRGSTEYLSGSQTPRPSDAAKRIIECAHTTDPGPLYVVAIGAITNVASALLLDPSIAEHIVVVWLGGNPLWWHTAAEFNLQQDFHASRFVFDCGVPLVQIPCRGVASHLLTTIPELEVSIRGTSGIGDYLFDITAGFTDDAFAWGKVIWDISAIAWIHDGDWVPSNLVHSPILNENLTYSRDESRHLIRSAIFVNRNEVFHDLFTRIREAQ